MVFAHQIPGRRRSCPADSMGTVISRATGRVDKAIGLRLDHGHG
jgi:hypothetical protein